MIRISAEFTTRRDMRAYNSILRGKIQDKEEAEASEAASVVQTLMTSSHRCLVEVAEAEVASTLTWEEVVSISVAWVEVKEVKKVKANKGNSSRGNSHHPLHQKKKFPTFLRTQTSNN